MDIHMFACIFLFLFKSISNSYINKTSVNWPLFGKRDFVIMPAKCLFNIINF